MKTLNSVSFDITYKCNYRCKHCFNSSGNRPRNLELTDEQVRKIVHDIAAQDQIQCVYVGVSLFCGKM